MEYEDRAYDCRISEWQEDDTYAPIDLNACNVPFDPRAGCAISIECNLAGEKTLIGLTFVTELDQSLPHDITIAQAQALITAVSEEIERARARE